METMTEKKFAVCADNGVDALTTALREAVASGDSKKASEILATLSRNLKRETFEDDLAEEEDDEAEKSEGLEALAVLT